MGGIGTVEAAARKKSSKATIAANAKGKSAKPTKRLAARASAKAWAGSGARTESSAIAVSKAAVFVFDGDETEPLRKQVIRLLKVNGMRVNTDLRPPDTAEQFRDMAAALNLAIYVHGRVRNTPQGRSGVTITIRSGVTGRKIASANFEGQRHQLALMVEDGLWRRVKAPLGRACVSALKPGRWRHAPMRIEAGTPIEDSPRPMDGS
jgi:hypothetical protein